MKIDELILKASKSKNRVELNAYKNLKAELQKVLTTKNTPEYSDSLFVQTAAKYAKSLEDAIQQFQQADRKDLVKEYQSELDVIKELVPQEATPSEIMLAIYDYCGKREMMGWVDPNNHNLFQEARIPKKEMGGVMKHLKSVFPTTDGKKLMEIVKTYVVD